MTPNRGQQPQRPAGTPTPVSTSTSEPPSSQRWSVMVRHSPFLLKNAVVEAADIEEAKRKFIDLCRQRHEQRKDAVAGQRGLDAQTIADTQRRIMTAFKQGLDNQASLEWDVRPAAEVEAERKRLKEDRERMLGGVSPR